MKKRTNRILLICLAILVVAAVARISAPRPIVADVEKDRIVELQYNPHFNEETQEIEDIVTITDYDERAVLECLNRYREQGPLARASSDLWIGDVELYIAYEREGEERFLLLGNLDYSYAGPDTPKYFTKDAAELSAELLTLLGLPPRS